MIGPFFSSDSLMTYRWACREAGKKLVAHRHRIAYGLHQHQYALRVTSPLSRPDRLAFYFHGGAWTFGRPETFVAAAGPWLAAGFTVLLPSYRRLPRVGLPGVVEDCRALLAQAVPPGGRVSHLHVGGMSAGAHLAAVLALRTDFWRAAGWPRGPGRALVCGGPLCLQKVRPRLYFGGFKDLDPCRLSLSGAGGTEWLLLHGRTDRLVPRTHSIAFSDRLEKAGAKARLLSLTGGHLAAGRWMFGGAGSEEVRRFIGSSVGEDAGAKVAPGPPGPG